MINFKTLFSAFQIVHYLTRKNINFILVLQVINEFYKVFLKLKVFFNKNIHFMVNNKLVFLNDKTHEIN